MPPAGHTAGAGTGWLLPLGAAALVCLQGDTVCRVNQGEAPLLRGCMPLMVCACNLTVRQMFAVQQYARPCTGK